ncbi:MAG: response regulator [Burkholderiales bacterium]|nr:response regulator [Burkholderiales bacterium]MDE1929316.1 response regulator [Burkholderiales bacterium]MDE2157699.1 response regulator [Burkholderiales bacterium]MDE2503552.1 response regulator [Burkholderiales bacterium]
MESSSDGALGTRLQGTLLCIDADAASVAAVRAIVAPHAGVHLLEARRGREGLRLAQARRPGLVLLDLELPDEDALEVVRQIGALEPGCVGRLVLLTRHAFSARVVEAMSLGAREYWHKPVHEARLVTEMRRALQSAPALPAPC